MAERETLEDLPGAQLRALREALGISQRHLAEDVGLDQSVICRLERGADARWTTWSRLFRALGYRAELVAQDLDDAEDYFQDAIQRRKERMEEGRASRW